MIQDHPTLDTCFPVLGHAKTHLCYSFPNKGVDTSQAHSPFLSRVYVRTSGRALRQLRGSLGLHSTELENVSLPQRTEYLSPQQLPRVRTHQSSSISVEARGGQHFSGFSYVLKL